MIKIFFVVVFIEMYDVNAMRHSLYGVYYCQHGNGWLNMFNK